MDAGTQFDDPPVHSLIMLSWLLCAKPQTYLQTESFRFAADEVEMLKNLCPSLQL